jgi:hypothetical protein
MSLYHDHHRYFGVLVEFDACSFERCNFIIENVLKLANIDTITVEYDAR